MIGIDGLKGRYIYLKKMYLCHFLNQGRRGASGEPGVKGYHGDVGEAGINGRDG
jgi:hypothetical protein